MRTLIALSLALACGHAQADIWESLAGRWAGQGEVSGMAANIELEFRPALDGRGHHLAFFNRMRAADGKTWPFRAEAFYLCEKGGACHGHWYDTRGMTLPLKTASHDDRLVVEWGDDNTERGRTTYRIGADGKKLEITDEVRSKDGVWSVFGNTSAIRSSVAPEP